MLVSSLRRLRNRRGQFSLGSLKSGCCCVSSTICLTACFVPVEGATFTISGLGSCVTGSDGCCSAPWLTSGTHSWTAVDSGGATICSGGGSFTAGTTNTKNCTPSDGKCCGAYYIPNTLTATDALGSFGMSYSGTDISGNPQWEGCRVVTLMSCTVSTPGGTCLVADPTSGPVRICYILTCFASSTPHFQLLRVWPRISTGTLPTITWHYFQDSTTCGTGACSNAPPGPCGSPLLDTATGTTNTATTTPFSVSITPTADAGDDLADPIGGSVTISA